MKERSPRIRDAPKIRANATLNDFSIRARRARLFILEFYTCQHLDKQ